MRITSSIVLLIGIIAVSAASILIRNVQTQAPSVSLVFVDSPSMSGGVQCDSVS